MPRIYVEFAGMKQAGSRCRSISSSVSSIRSDFRRTVSQLDWDVKYKSDINSTAKHIAMKLDGYAQSLKSYQSFIDDAYEQYIKLEGEKFSLSVKEKTIWDKFVGEFHAGFGWSDMLKGSGYIGTIYNMIHDIKKGSTWIDLAKSGVRMYQFMDEAAKTYSNYKKIGNAVGTRTAMTWWAKKITGLKPLGRASSAKNPYTRFVNNLKNKTSPFNAQFKNTINNFKGANGVGKAAAAWAGVAVTGVTNWYSNKEEQANSNGTMSNRRVIAETVTETAIDTALIYGTGIVVGAAVTTVLGTAAVPGIVVVALSGAVSAGLNAGVKALTGKTTTEWLSDTILDTGESIGRAVGNAAKKVSNSIGGWYRKLSYA
ncbi:MAG: hypothetical protein HFH14_10265 [Lachnospiraceae bacterium]|nr:hypothetical protein [Lachnospiraceae bacterium]